MSLELDDEVFIGPITDAELSKQQQRRRTLIELPTPVGKRILSMSVKSFVVVPQDQPVEPETPAKVFEILKERQDLDRFQIRYKNQAMRELLMEADDDAEVWTPPAIPSFVWIPETTEEKDFIPFEAVEEMVSCTGDERECCMIAVENPQTSAAFLVPTPSKSRRSVVENLANSSRTAEERAIRLSVVLADREASKASQPQHDAWKLALPWLTEEQKQRIATAAA
jgi:hypothetical protein